MHTAYHELYSYKSVEKAAAAGEKLAAFYSNANRTAYPSLALAHAKPITEGQEVLFSVFDQ